VVAKKSSGLIYFSSNPFCFGLAHSAGELAEKFSRSLNDGKSNPWLGQGTA
jgi:hypothetical protein